MKNPEEESPKPRTDERKNPGPSQTESQQTVSEEQEQSSAGAELPVEAATEAATVTQKYERVNVYVAERSGDETFKLYYKVKDVINATSVSWDLVDQGDGTFVAVFEACVHGQKYCNESRPIPKEARDNLTVKFKGPKQDDFKVKLKKTSTKEVYTSYFERKK